MLLSGTLIIELEGRPVQKETPECVLKSESDKSHPRIGCVLSVSCELFDRWLFLSGPAKLPPWYMWSPIAMPNESSARDARAKREMAGSSQRQPGTVKLRSYTLH